MKKIISTIIGCLLTTMVLNTYAEEKKEIKFPDNFEKLLSLPGKQDTIEIPMQKEYYKTLFTDMRRKSEILNNSIVKENFEDNYVTVNINTKDINETIEINDVNKNYRYRYYFLAGHLMNITIEISIDSDKQDRISAQLETEAKTDYVLDRIEKYLNKNNFDKKFSISDYLSNELTYEKDDIIVKTVSAYKTVFVKILNKKLEKDRKILTKESLNKKLDSTTGQIMNEILQE